MSYSDVAVMSLCVHTVRPAFGNEKTGDGTHTGGGAKTGDSKTGKCKGATRSNAPLEAAHGGPSCTGMYPEDGGVFLAEVKIYFQCLVLCTPKFRFIDCLINECFIVAH